MAQKRKNVVVDTHADTIKRAWLHQCSLGDTSLDINVVNLRNQVPYIQCFAAYIEPELEQVVGGGYQRACAIISHYHKEYRKLKESGFPIVNIVSPDQLERVVNQEQFGVILTIENGTAISGNLENLCHFYEKGVRMMSLTWDRDNDLGCGAFTKEDTGLTLLGKKCIALMNQFGMIVDVSHASYQSFFDIIADTTRPILASHSCVDALCHHVRNLKEEQIIEIGKLKGVIGVTFYSPFICEKGPVSSDDIIDHILYIANKIGIDHVGIGGDFDGMGEDKKEYPIDLQDATQIRVLEEKMRKRGFREEEIEKVMGGNHLRFLQNNL